MAGRAQPSKTMKQGRQNAVPSRNKFLVMGLLLPFAGMLLPTLTVLALGLLPTLGAYVADRSREKHLALTVGLMNLCGCLPALAKLWAAGQSFVALGRVVHDAYGWLIAYGAAGCGWAIYLLMPAIVAAHYQVSSTSQIQALKQSQRTLIELWGEEVAETSEATDG